MTVYHRKNGINHYMRTCSQWPGNAHVREVTRNNVKPATGTICPECIAKDKAATKKRNKWKKRELV